MVRSNTVHHRIRSGAHVTRILIRQLAAALLRRATPDLADYPRPSDSRRQIAPGPNVDRVLIAGGGIGSGAGVRAQELALPGRLAEALSTATGRGAVVDVAADPGVTAGDTEAMLASARIEHYDAIILTLGTSEAYRLVPVAAWTASLERVLDALTPRLGRGSVLYITSAAPLSRPLPNDVGFRRLRTAHADRLDAATAAVVAERPAVRFVATDEPDADVRWNCTADYDRLARRLAPILRPQLDAISSGPPLSARQLRASRDPELLRQRALERSGLLQPHDDEGLLRLLRNAAAQTGVPVAAVTLIDGDEQRTRAIVGVESLDMPRLYTLCNWTIRKAGAHVETDSSTIATPEHDWRFYAGYPLESPDGYRVGALCMLDTTARQADYIDEDTLAQLATRVQNLLWDQLRSEARVSVDS